MVVYLFLFALCTIRRAGYKIKLFLSKTISKATIIGFTQTTTMNDKPETSSESVKGSKIRPPWYPFKSATDFDFAEYVVQNNLSQPAIEDLLRRQRNVWTTSPDAVNISFKNYKDLRYYLDRAKSSRTNVIILFYFLHIYLLMRLSV